MLLQASLIPLRAVQWQPTLSKPVPFRERYHLVAIGAFTHNALPGKLGDVIRSFLLSRTQRIPFLQSLGSVAVCKLLEFAALMLLVAAVLPGSLRRDDGPLRGRRCRWPCRCASAWWRWWCCWPTTRAPLARLLHRRHRLPRAGEPAQHVARGPGHRAQLPGHGEALLFSVGPVLAPALALRPGAARAWASAGASSPGAVVLGAIALGQSLPGRAGGHGHLLLRHQLGGAQPGGLGPEDAAAFSTLTHLGTVSARWPWAPVSVHQRKLRIRDLRKGGSLAREAAHHVAHEAVEPAPP